MQAKGEGVDRDYEQAMSWFRKSSQQRCVTSICDGVTARPAMPLADDLTYLLLSRARDGDAQSQYFVGRIYACGERIDQDLFAAAKWLEKAAEQGIPEAKRICRPS